MARLLTATPVIVPIVLLVSSGLASCSMEEKICKPGQVVVEGAGGGRWCEQPKPRERTCPDDEIVHRFQATGREECIPNIYPPPGGSAQRNAQTDH